MIRVGLISDTHIPEAGPDLPAQVYYALRGVDLILHAGDMHVVDVLDWLEEVAPVIAVRGNGDYSTPGIDRLRPGVPDDPRVEDRQILQLEELRVGLIHGFPLPEEVPWTTLGDMMAFHFGEVLDIIVCGDTHLARIDRYPGLLIVNSGSPTLPGQMRALGTIGILQIDGRHVEASIVNLQE